MLNDTFLSSFSPAPASLADPPGSSVIAAAVSWIEATLLGPLATSVAVIAVATVGLKMLAGRVNVRHGVTVIAGCFILFGATTIAAGIQSSVGADELAAMPPAPPPIAPAPPAPPVERVLPANNDPYAGAAVPMR